MISHSWTLRALTAATALWLAGPTRALQPLEVFVRGARTWAPDNREAQANTALSRAETLAAESRLLPGVSVTGSYTRNQYEGALPLAGGKVAVLTPQESFDAVAVLTVPLADLGNFARAGAARTASRATRLSEQDAALQTEALVAQGYYQVLADRGLVESSQRALDVARTTLTLTQRQRAAGAVAGLDVDRAQAEVERQVQQLAGAQLRLELDVRALASLTGVAPELTGPVELGDDLHEEAPLESFVPEDAALPGLAAAVEARRAQEETARAERLALLPSLAGTFSEHATTAPGAPDTAYQAVVALRWAFDGTSVAAIRAEDARLDAAAAREVRVRLARHDAIHRTWNTVHTDLARSRSARAQAQVSQRASDLARERYRVGAAAQLDLLQAQRDAFAADVNRIQADADLVNARAQLRLAAGRSLLPN
ncbi:MAG TPA: TolC family protein [Anaeromyxobacteraceae bacterium]|jgi:outer membrane protein TolC|nr:TolC family protein [Anaeromyxobacteraceae bacterium]